jgi:hypothetical protein
MVLMMSALIDVVLLLKLAKSEFDNVLRAIQLDANDENY